MPKLSRVPLTMARVEAALREAKQDGKPVRLTDARTEGLAVRAYPTGHLAWSVVYRIGDAGKWRDYTLRNVVPDAGRSALDVARTLADAVRAGVREGRDPLDSRTAQRTAPTVAEAFPRWLDTLRTAKRRKASTVGEYERLWRTDIEPALGGLLVAAVTPRDVRDLFHSVTLKSPSVANRVRSRLHTFFRWCETEELRPYHSNPVVHDIESNPMERPVRALDPSQRRAILAALDLAEREGLPTAPHLVHAMKPKAAKASDDDTAPKSRAEYMRERRQRLGLNKTDRTFTHAKPRKTRTLPPTRTRAPQPVRPANPDAVAALRFLVESGWRRNEALTLTWGEVRFDESIAMLNDTKTGASLRPLSADAIAILRAQRARHSNRIGAAQYVFPGTREPGTPYRSLRHLWASVLHAAALGRPVRLHDLRHTMASDLVSAGEPLTTAMAVLGHKDIKSAARYAVSDTRAVRDALDRLSGARAKAPTDAAVIPIRREGTNDA